MSSPVEELADSIKWMTTNMKWCYVCNARKRHNFGVKYIDGKEMHVQECLGCQTLTDQPPE